MKHLFGFRKKIKNGGAAENVLILRKHLTPGGRIGEERFSKTMTEGPDGYYYDFWVNRCYFPKDDNIENRVNGLLMGMANVDEGDPNDFVESFRACVVKRDKYNNFVESVILKHPEISKIVGNDLSFNKIDENVLALINHYSTTHFDRIEYEIIDFYTSFFAEPHKNQIVNWR